MCDHVARDVEERRIMGRMGMSGHTGAESRFQILGHMGCRGTLVHTVAESWFWILGHMGCRRTLGHTGAESQFRILGQMQCRCQDTQVSNPDFESWTWVVTLLMSVDMGCYIRFYEQITTNLNDTKYFKVFIFTNLIMCVFYLMTKLWTCFDRAFKNECVFII